MHRGFAFGMKEQRLQQLSRVPIGSEITLYCTYRPDDFPLFAPAIDAHPTGGNSGRPSDMQCT